MFDTGDTIALILGLAVSAIIVLACMGAYARKQAFTQQL